MLNDFILEGAPLEVPAARAIVPNISRLLLQARQEKKPVLFICDSHAQHDPEFENMGWPPHAVAGSEGARVIETLNPMHGEDIVNKSTYFSFYGTDLDERLRSRSVNSLLLAGCVTNICILYAAAEAVIRGYSVSVPENCVAALSQDDHRFALRQMRDVLGVQVVEPCNQ